MFLFYKKMLSSAHKMFWLDCLFFSQANTMRCDEVIPVSDSISRRNNDVFKVFSIRTHTLSNMSPPCLIAGYTVWSHTRWTTTSVLSWCLQASSASRSLSHLCNPVACLLFFKLTWGDTHRHRWLLKVHLGGMCR